MLELYHSKGISATLFPINDHDEKVVVDKLYYGALLLNNMIAREQKKPYVYCTSGMGRGPEVVITYLCLYKNMEPEAAQELVKKCKEDASPHMDIITDILSKYKK